MYYEYFVENPPPLNWKCPVHKWERAPLQLTMLICIMTMSMLYPAAAARGVPMVGGLVIYIFKLFKYTIVGWHIEPNRHNKQLLAMKRHRGENPFIVRASASCPPQLSSTVPNRNTTDTR